MLLRLRRRSLRVIEYKCRFGTWKCCDVLQSVTVWHQCASFLGNRPNSVLLHTVQWFKGSDFQESTCFVKDPKTESTGSTKLGGISPDL